MHQEGGSQTNTFVEVLNVHVSLVALEDAHEQIIQSGCESDVFVANSHVDIYAKCGSIEDAWRVNSTRWPHEIWSLGMP
jgi:hypothetical protein